MLQAEGVSDVPSVAVKKLQSPALQSGRGRRGAHEPARGGGVMKTGRPEMPQQQPDAAPRLGGKLNPPRPDARQPRHRRDHRPHPFARQRLGHRPDQILSRRVGGSGTQQHEPVQRKAHGGQRRGIEFTRRVAPDEGGGGTGVK